MADNVISDPGSGGATFATDDIGGIHYTINKITFGALDSSTLASSGAGNVDAGTQRVVLATDQAVVSIDDNAGSITVDNSGTFAVQSTLQAGTAEIGKLATGVAEIGNIKNSGTFLVQSAQSGTYNITNISGTISLPTGAATAAKQLADGHNVTIDNSTGASAVNIQDGGNSITVDNGGTFVTQIDGDALTSLQLLDNAVSGAGYNITQFNGVNVSMGNGVSGTGVQRVTIASDTTGVLSVDDNGGSLTVDSAAAFTIQEDGAALTALQLLDDVVATLGTTTYSEATTKGNIIGAVRNDVLAPLADTNNEISPLQVDELGALWICDAPNVIDSGNSTTSTLSGAATFTGTGVDILNYTMVSTQVFADQDSAANGMRFEFSIDNTNWDVSHQHDFIIGTTRTFQLPAHAKFYRFVFVNGATPQGAFRVQTILHRQNSLTTIHRLDDNLAPDRSSVIVKASIIAQAAGTGDFIPINSTAGGNLKVAIEEFDASLPTGSNLIGDVGISVRTSGGTTLYKNIDVDESEDEVKATAGQVYWIHAINSTAAPLFLKFYDLAAASVTVGTTVPDLTFPVPGNADSDGAGFTLSIPNGIEFGTGITIAATTGVADNDSGAPGANALVVNLGFA